MVQRYDIGTNSWNSMADLKTPIYRCYPCFVRGHELCSYDTGGELLSIVMNGTLGLSQKTHYVWASSTK